MRLKIIKGRNSTIRKLSTFKEMYQLVIVCVCMCICVHLCVCMCVCACVSVMCVCAYVYLCSSFFIFDLFIGDDMFLD